MKRIKIFPIFNQAAPRVWDDFLRIRTITRQHNYNINSSPTDINDALTEFKENWSRPSQNFALAAYDNNEIIGFVSGTYNAKIARIQHLYVLPQYQGMHIGRQLLDAAESAISVNTTQVDLISMGTSDKFYEKHGYKSYTQTNHYNKTVKNAGHCTVTPVFRCTPTLIKQFAKLSNTTPNEFDTQKIAQTRTPLFIYRDTNSKITAFGVCGHTPKIYGTSDWAKTRIAKTITEYQSMFTVSTK